MKSADQVLPLRKIHPGLAADAGINHRKQRGRNLDEIDSAHVNRRGKSGHVAGHSTADGNQQRLAVEPAAGGLPADLPDSGERLMLLAGGKHVQRFGSEMLRRPFAPELLYVRIGHHHPPTGMSFQRFQANPGSDHDLIGPAAQSDHHMLHCHANHLALPFVLPRRTRRNGNLFHHLSSFRRPAEKANPNGQARNTAVPESTKTSAPGKARNRPSAAVSQYSTAHRRAQPHPGREQSLPGTGAKSSSRNSPVSAAAILSGSAATRRADAAYPCYNSA